MLPSLHTRYVFSLAIKIGAPVVAGDFGYGVRRIIPILGGEVRGEGIEGTILPYGADFQTIRQYLWLMQNLFVAVGARYPDRVEIDVHQLWWAVFYYRHPEGE